MDAREYAPAHGPGATSHRAVAAQLLGVVIVGLAGDEERHGMPVDLLTAARACAARPRFHPPITPRRPEVVDLKRFYGP